MADYLKPVADLLAERFKVYRYEQRGCGRSEDTGPFTLAGFVSDIEALRHHWGVQQWFVAGHSWGVDLGLAYATQYFASVLGLAGLAGGRIHNDRTWKQAYDKNKHRETPVPAAADPNREVNKTLNDDWKAHCRRPELLRELSKLGTRTLFIYGERDIRPSWPTEQLSQLLPNAEFVRLADADHHLWQGNPEGLRNVLQEFFLPTLDKV
jgi:proline iminopeptidase